MRRLRFVVVALLLVLAPSIVSAGGSPRSEEPRFLFEGWTLKMLPALGWLGNAAGSILEKTGCAIDPLGRCAPSSQNNTGCAIDPASGGDCRQ